MQTSRITSYPNRLPKSELSIEESSSVLLLGLKKVFQSRESIVLSDKLCIKRLNSIK